MQVEELYNQQIRNLSTQSRLQLLALIARDLAAASPNSLHRITELRGLGKEIWQGVEAQQYVNELRDEWDKTP